MLASGIDPQMRFAMPGQSGDAPGIVRLYHRADGKLLHEADVEMVQQFPGVEWSHDVASIQLLADWELPAAR